MSEEDQTTSNLTSEDDSIMKNSDISEQEVVQNDLGKSYIGKNYDIEKPIEDPDSEIFLNQLNYNESKLVESNLLTTEVQTKLAPSPVSELEDDFEGSFLNFEEQPSTSPTITVKLQVEGHETLTTAFKIHFTVQQVKERLSNIFNIKSEEMRLYYDEKECDDLLPLSGLGVEPMGTIELIMRTTDPGKKITRSQYLHYIPVVDIITVRIDEGEGRSRDVIVEIENQQLQKEWLGGYRHRLTRIEYHHAAVQTKPRQQGYGLPPGQKPPEIITRQTQTPGFPHKDKGTSPMIHKCTQALPSDNLIPNLTDRIITGVAGRFQVDYKVLTFPEVVGFVVVVQRFLRSYMKRKEEREEVELVEKCLENEQFLNSQYLTSTKDDRTKKLMTGNIFPTSQFDFYVLYLLVGKWWKKEYDRIKTMKSEETRKAAFVALLDKEVTLLWAIERHRITAKKESMRKKEINFLEETARPVVFRNYNGFMSAIDTLETQKAREYQDMYLALINRDVTLEQRLDTLHKLRSLLNTIDDYNKVKPILNLINRECELLAIGVESSDLEGLRNRIEQQLLHHFHDNRINPKVEHYKKAKRPRLAGMEHLCKMCKKVKPACEFNVHVKMTKFDVCHSCEWTRNVGHQRIDLSPYMKMLRLVRFDEMKLCTKSAVSFILQVVGMYFLTNFIWEGRSVISEITDLNKLRMKRWRMDIDWSPWNCILITNEESIIHEKLKNVDDFYDKAFIKKVQLKHRRARTHFLPLLMSDNYIRETGLWYKAENYGKFLQGSNYEQFLKSDDPNYMK
ncbi:hypothetical protein LSTR_LSTR008669 [Laodelphax striatellus]|uniref:Ubiquitin-like domain-containing protein n=1 Tax=Laodelphax striatellus TaxID=195883 RepID=A0A482X5N7_LAOST|nr:hypothetical protein LSTR_LSTR008669 [Laodelphax striatellus]